MHREREWITLKCYSVSLGSSEMDEGSGVSLVARLEAIPALAARRRWHGKCRSALASGQESIICAARAHKALFDLQAADMI